jgi:hypothetical protein
LSDTLKIVYRARNEPEAHLLKTALEDAGIKAVVMGVDTVGWQTIVGWPALPGVAVAPEDADAARQTVEQFERSPPEAVEAGPEETAKPEEPGVPSRWPRCPGCGSPRLMQCRFCGTAGTGFRLADQVEDEPSPQSAGGLVICPTCDEATAPTYLQECEWCGHRFADGVPPPQDAFRTEWTWRVVVAVVAMAAILAGMIVYFAWLV